jgi:glycopeptide antibiotics resistance protein
MIRSGPVKPCCRPPAPRRAHFLGLLLAYVAAAVYGSLVPLWYRSLPWAETIARFQSIRYLDLGVESRADWVANGLLFIPIGFLAAAALMADRNSRWRTALAAVIVALFCGVLSVAIEFAQVWFPPRTVSLNDIIAETFGGFFGLSLWLGFGDMMTVWLRRITSERRPSLQIAWLLQAYVLALVAYSLLPLDVAIAPEELARKYHDGRLLLSPFGTSASPVDIASGVAIKLATFAPVGYLLATSRGRQSIGGVALRGLALVAGIELAQVFIYSRTADASDVPVGVVGVLLGAVAARRYLGDVSTSRWAAWSHSRGFWWSVTALYVVVLLAAFWSPYDLLADEARIARRLTKMFTRVPFSILYWGTDFQAMQSIVRKVGWFVPLGGLLTLAVAGRSRRRTFLDHGAVILMGLAVATVVELGQVFVASRIADITDVLLGGMGVVLGIALASRLAPGAVPAVGSAVAEISLGGCL